MSSSSSQEVVTKQPLKINRWKVFWRLIAFARPEYFKIALGLVGLSINAVTNLAFPWLIGKALDQSSVENLTNFLYKNSYFFFAGTFASWLRIYCLGSATESISNRLRMQLFDSFLAQDMSYYESLESGEIVSLLENDVTASSELLTEKIGNLLRSLNSSINGSFSLYRTSSQLCKITLSIVPIVGIAAMTLSRYSRALAIKLRDQQSKILSYSLERIRCISTVRLNNREDYEHEKFSSLIAASNSVAVSRFHVHGSFMSFVNLFTNLSLIAILRAGGKLVSEGSLSVGFLSSFAIQSVFVGLGFSGLSTFYSDTVKALDAASRIFTILDRGREHAQSQPVVAATGEASIAVTSQLQAKQQQELQPLIQTASAAATATNNGLNNNSSNNKREGGKKMISVHDLSYLYPSRPSNPVLTHLSIDIPLQEITCFIGKSGSGKSTLAALLAGLYTPSSGEIVYFGQLINRSSATVVGEAVAVDKEKKKALFNLVGVVEQSSATLLTGTIRENIAYGLNQDQQQAGDSEKQQQIAIENAAKAANAHEFITSFPAGYDTEIGEAGCLLSGGQRARIALARALVKQPSFLVLDEPTSALDHESEMALIAPLQELRKKTTIIIFTHSEHLQKIADKVYTLKEGKLLLQEE